VQGFAATIIALSGRYEQILNYVVSIDFISFALTAASLFVFRRRETTTPANIKEARYRVPGHPYTTTLFVLACAAIVATTIITYPTNSVFGFIILAAGIPVYLYWSRKPRAAATASQ
jgi:APA family basic amino acid/polyamine antiporter